MTTSYSCEHELRELANELYRKADELEKAADVLREFRETPDLEKRVESAKTWAKDWMRRDL